MELVSPNSQCQDIEALYCDIYQLHRLPIQSRCKEPMAEWLCKEILDSIKEHLNLKQPPTQQERHQIQLLADNPRPDPNMAFTAAYQRAYKEMMAHVRDAWQWALVAAVILKEQMESMGCPTDHWCSTSHWHSTSHWCYVSCRRSRSLGWQEDSSQVTQCHGETEARPEISQATSCWRGTGDTNLYKYLKISQVT